MKNNSVNFRLALLFILVLCHPLCYLHSRPCYPFMSLPKVRLTISILSKLLMHCVTACTEGNRENRGNRGQCNQVLTACSAE